MTRDLTMQLRVLVQASSENESGESRVCSAEDAERSSDVAYSFWIKETYGRAVPECMFQQREGFRQALIPGSLKNALCRFKKDLDESQRPSKRSIGHMLTRICLQRESARLTLSHDDKDECFPVLAKLPARVGPSG
jgi:hypothetical protein